MKALITSYAVSIILQFFCARATAQPSNDFYANRTVLTGTSVSVLGDNTGATTEPGEDAGAYPFQYLNSVWYGWTAPAAGELYWSVNPTSNSFSVMARFFIDNNGGISNLTLASAASDGGYIVSAGETLAIQVATTVLLGNGDQTGPFMLGLSENVLPVTSTNDNFANSATIAAPGCQFSGFINGATVETNEPLPDPSVTQTLWWTFQPANDGILNLSVNASGFSPWLTVYQGTGLAALTNLPALTGGIYRLQAGQTYDIQLAAAALPMFTGSFTLTANYTPQEPVNNDLFANAEALTGTNLTYYGNFSSATSEPGEPFNGATNTIWVSWTAPFTGRAEFGLGAAGQYFGVYTGPSVDQLQAVPLFGQAFVAMQGTNYYFQLSGAGANVLFNLTASPFALAPYDNFAQAQVLVGTGATGVPSSVVGATMEPGEPQHLGPVPQKSVWWEWQAPDWCSNLFSAAGGLVSNPVIAVYTGNNVAALTPVASGTNTVTFFATGGQTYHIAEAVPTNAIGDLMLSVRPTWMMDSSVHIIPGNLLQEPSWEGTALTDTTYWHWTGALGGYVDEPNDVDGVTWPAVSSGQKLWQTIPTIPGHFYEVHFACLFGGSLTQGSGDANVEVFWDANSMGTFNIPGAQGGFWNWADLTFTATNTTTTVTFQNLSRPLEMDAFSVLDQTAPPAIVTQPAPISTVVGGTAEFGVGVIGSSPLFYQWFFNGNPLTNQNNSQLVLTSVSTNDVGNYMVVVSNAFGTTNSTVAALQVNTSPYPDIVWQPYGGTLPWNSYFTFDVAAVGPPPLSYQWYFDGSPISNATNQTLMFTALQLTNAGTYSVSVQNPAATVFSLPTSLVVSTNLRGGGVIYFNNFAPPLAGPAPIYDLDGVTRLSGSNYLAQLYAGPSLAGIHPAGAPEPFEPSFQAGYFVPEAVVLADVPVGSNAVAQVRVWEAAKGDSYEQARALGGKFGESSMLTVQTTGLPPIPMVIPGLQSFSLQAGLPYFEQALIQYVQELPDGSMVWSLTGEPNYLYLIEENTGNNVWQPTSIRLLLPQHQLVA